MDLGGELLRNLALASLGGVLKKKPSRSLKGTMGGRVGGLESRVRVDGSAGGEEPC